MTWRPPPLRPSRWHWAMRWPLRCCRSAISREDFARLHPGGALGRKLTLRVANVMVTQDLPVLGAGATMRECIVLLAEKRGTVVVLTGRRVVGVVTAGWFSSIT